MKHDCGETITIRRTPSSAETLTELLVEECFVFAEWLQYPHARSSSKEGHVLLAWCKRM